MFKRFFLTLAVLAGLFSPAMGAGTITISLTQRLDNSTHLPLSGGKIYFIQAGTTATPQNAYQDSALTIAYANPLTLDSGGNIPQLFFADGVIKIRITNSAGVQQIVQDNIQVTGASSGGGGGGTVDPTTILATGDMKVTYGTGILSGFVRANGRTIGSATSGATERANSDTQALFLYLWGADANLAVSGGRGASAAADWAANKTLALPDWRGRAIAGLDDMGNSAAVRITSTTASPNGTTLGAAAGGQVVTVAQANLPNVTVNISGNVSTNSTLNYSEAPLGVVAAAFASGTGGSVYYLQGGQTPIQGKAAATGTITSGTTASLNGNTAQTAMNNMPPTMLATIYLKL